MRHTIPHGRPMPAKKTGGIEDGQMEANRVTASLAGLALMLALVIGGFLLMRHMRDQARLEDCLMTGRINCAPIAMPLH